VINPTTNTVTQTVNLGSGQGIEEDALVYNPNNGDLYFQYTNTDAANSIVDVVNPSTMTTLNTFNAIPTPTAQMSINPYNGDIYIDGQVYSPTGSLVGSYPGLGLEATPVASNSDIYVTGSQISGGSATDVLVDNPSTDSVVEIISNG